MKEDDGEILRGRSLPIRDDEEVRRLEWAEMPEKKNHLPEEVAGDENVMRFSWQ